MKNISSCQLESSEIKKTCETCDWHDAFTWACCNGDSPYRADFTDKQDTCDKWRAKSTPETPQNES